MEKAQQLVLHVQGMIEMLDPSIVYRAARMVMTASDQVEATSVL